MSDLLLAGTNSMGFYKALVTEGSAANPTWAAVSDGLTGDDLKILHWNADQRHGDRAYACTKHYGVAGGNLYRNSNLLGGGAWNHLTLPTPTDHDWLDPLLICTHVYTSPGFDDHLLAVVQYTGPWWSDYHFWHYYSTTAGDSWTETWAVPVINQVQSVSFCPTTPTQGYESLSSTGRDYIGLVTGLNTAATWSELQNLGISTNFALASPDDDAVYWWHGNNTAYIQRNGVTLPFTIGGNMLTGFGAGLIESSIKARFITGSTAWYLLGTDDGATVAFERNTPPWPCGTVYGYNGWYYIGKGGSGSHPDYRTVWVTDNEGVAFSVADGPQPGDIYGVPAVDSIPYNCGGIVGLALLRISSAAISGYAPGYVKIGRTLVNGIRMGLAGANTLLNGVRLGAGSSGLTYLSGVRLGV